MLTYAAPGPRSLKFARPCPRSTFYLVMTGQRTIFGEIDVFFSNLQDNSDEAMANIAMQHEVIHVSSKEHARNIASDIVAWEDGCF